MSLRIVIWNVKDCVFKVRVKCTDGVTADCLLMYWIMFKFSHIITRNLDRYLLYFKQRNCQTESVITVWENSGDLLSDLQKIQYRFLSLFETFSFVAVPTYRFTSTQLRQSLNSICSSQPNGHERISCQKFHVRSANELQTDDCTTEGRITERIVR
jgi:hypothetical protein